MDTANIDFAADVWSLGMVIHEIISGEVPFDNEEYRSLKLEDFLARLKAGARPQMPRDYAHITWLKDLVSMLYYWKMQS
jgi:serine/threonine protein kinase